MYWCGQLQKLTVQYTGACVPERPKVEQRLAVRDMLTYLYGYTRTKYGMFHPQPYRYLAVFRSGCHVCIQTLARGPAQPQSRCSLGDV
jgi:hypothetical protein